MASFAKITEDNEVLQVLAVDDKDVLNAENVEEEAVGQAYLEPIIIGLHIYGFKLLTTHIRIHTYWVVLLLEETTQV